VTRSRPKVASHRTVQTDSPLSVSPRRSERSAIETGRGRRPMSADEGEPVGAGWALRWTLGVNRRETEQRSRRCHQVVLGRPRREGRPDPLLGSPSTGQTNSIALGGGERLQLLAETGHRLVANFKDMTAAASAVRTSCRQSLPLPHPCGAVVRAQGARDRQLDQLRTVSRIHTCMVSKARVGRPPECDRGTMSEQPDRTGPHPPSWSSRACADRSLAATGV
jgi:hypothetical protein